MSASESSNRNTGPQPERFHRWRNAYDLEQLRLFYVQARTLQNPGARAPANVFRNPGGRPSGSATAIWDDNTGPVTRTLHSNPSAFTRPVARDVVIRLSQDQRREMVQTLPDSATCKRTKKKHKLAKGTGPAPGAGDNWNPIMEELDAGMGEDDEDEEGAVSILMDGTAIGDEEDGFGGTGKRKRYASSVCPLRSEGCLSHKIIGQSYVPIHSRISSHPPRDSATRSSARLVGQTVLHVMWAEHWCATYWGGNRERVVSVRHMW